MSFDYSEMAAVSLDLLTEFGQDVTRIAYTPGAYNPATGTSTPTTASTTRKGALFDIARGTQYLNGTLVERGDKQLLVDAEGAVNIEDRFTVNGVVYQIVSMAEVNPAGTPVLYDLHVRVS